jgi:alpha,alpha-trehalase
MSPERANELDRLSASAEARIGPLRAEVLRKANGALPCDYIVPNGVYEEQWDWDAFFVGLHLVSASRSDGLYLRNWCLNFLHHMEPDGQTPGGIRPWSGRDARLYQLKPLMGQAAFYASLALGDFGWIDPLWDKMSQCVTYRERKMTDPETGLAKWWDSMESGADNNVALVRRYHNSMAGVDVNAFLVLDYRAMACIADRIGRPADAAAFRGRASDLAAAVNTHLWDETDGTYYTYDTVEKALVRRGTYSNQVALWARLASPARAQRMIEGHILNPLTLWSAHGVRSLALDDPQYNNENVLKPYSNWQGPIWPHANWMVMHALLHYGYGDAALEVAERVTRVCLDDLAANGMMHENYHADTGAPLAAPRFISWNLLVVQMIREARSGTFLPDPDCTLWQC